MLATGTSPPSPPIPGLADISFWTNHDAMEAEDGPASIIVLGGGAVGAELTQAYSRFGAQITVVEGAARLLAREEPEAGRGCLRVREEGVDVSTGAAPGR